MRAFCYASGRIEFGRSLPGGTLPIAIGPAKKVREFMCARARHAYDGETLLVPGVPEAANQMDAVDALMAWSRWLSETAPAGIEMAFTAKSK
jgi:hypothetical protein